jgi:hypothetical protein
MQHNKFKNRNSYILTTRVAGIKEFHLQLERILTTHTHFNNIDISLKLKLIA